MKLTVVNKGIKIDGIKVGTVSSSSVVLIGDTETITSSSYFDTPSNSLIYSLQIPIKQVGIHPSNHT
jgi:spore germination protein PD